MDNQARKNITHCWCRLTRQGIDGSRTNTGTIVTDLFYVLPICSMSNSMF